MRAEARFVPLESRRFVTIEINEVDGYPLTDSDEWASLDGAIARAKYTATREQAARIDNTVIARALLDAGAFRAEVVPTILPEQRARVVVDEHADVGDAVGLYLAALDVDDETRAAMRGRHDLYADEVGA